MAEHRSTSEIEAEIERKRLELAHTLDSLGTRLDVKSRMRERVRPQHLALAGGAVVLAVSLVLWRRRR